MIKQFSKQPPTYSLLRKDVDSVGTYKNAIWCDRGAVLKTVEATDIRHEMDTALY